MSDRLRFHTTGVLVMAHGTPQSTEEIEPFYTRIRRGRPPSTEQLADLERRYEAIGGVSPLGQITVAQAQAIRWAMGLRVPVAIGTKFASPSIEEAIGTLRSWGVHEIVGMVLSPQYSSTTTEEYFRRAREAVAVSGSSGGTEATISFVESWHLDPALIGFLGREVSRCVQEAGGAHVLFSAHSLPVAAVANDDPYVEQVEETAWAVADAAGLQRENWSRVWQSAGRTEAEWLGPDIRDALADLAGSGVSSVVVCPVGFSADNLESLVDLDIEAAQVARELGLRFCRTALPNADPGVAASLAQRIVEVAWAMEGESS